MKKVISEKIKLSNLKFKDGFKQFLLTKYKEHGDIKFKHLSNIFACSLY